MRLRTVLAALGVATVAAGLAIVLQPSLAGDVAPTSVFVTMVGFLGLLQAATAARSRLQNRRREATFSVVERPRTFPTPGEEFDRRLADLPTLPPRSADRERALLRERLRTAAVGVLARYGGFSAERAETALEEGTWTADPDAVAFFAPDADPALSLTDRVRDALAAERVFIRRACAAVDALDRYAADPDSEAAVDE